METSVSIFFTGRCWLLSAVLCFICVMYIVVVDSSSVSNKSNDSRSIDTMQNMKKEEVALLEELSMSVNEFCKTFGKVKTFHEHLFSRNYYADSDCLKKCFDKKNSSKKIKSLEAIGMARIELLNSLCLRKFFNDCEFVVAISGKNLNRCYLNNLMKNKGKNNKSFEYEIDETKIIQGAVESASEIINEVLEFFSFGGMKGQFTPFISELSVYDYFTKTTLTQLLVKKNPLQSIKDITDLLNEVNLSIQKKTLEANQEMEQSFKTPEYENLDIANRVHEIDPNLEFKNKSHIMEKMSELMDYVEKIRKKYKSDALSKTEFDSEESKLRLLINNRFYNYKKVYLKKCVDTMVHGAVAPTLFDLQLCIYYFSKLPKTSTYDLILGITRYASTSIINTLSQFIYNHPKIDDDDDDDMNENLKKAIDIHAATMYGKTIAYNLNLKEKQKEKKKE